MTDPSKPFDRITGYDEDKNESYRWVTEEKRCRQMAKRYGWRYKGHKVDPKAKILKVQCIYDGNTEIPPDYTEKED